MISNILFKLLEKIGRRYITYTSSGILVSDKYMIFKPGVHMYDGSTFWKRLPEVYIHKWFSSEEWQHEYQHSHGRNSYSLILSGGYTETISGVVTNRRPGSFKKLRYDQQHDVSNILPGTTTIFILGFYRDFQVDVSRKLLMVKYTPGILEKLARKRKAYLKLQSKT